MKLIAYAQQLAIDPAAVFEAHQRLLTVTFEGLGSPAGRMPINCGSDATSA
ncbi:MULTISPECIES: hypothetical protein [Streptacidiphilus]|uniref:Uncharacterized protein n=1 Tax=Streptacidiphilus cavernicola TaxID=3342716 RepID=A0ABV6UWA2_9ACTN|nr:hypothetical protein [Streptacidiphilus jeojiense]